VAEVVQLFTPKLRVKRVRVEVSAFPPTAIVEGDGDAVKQVFFNLLYNALQAIHHDHGLVRIHVDSGQDGVDVSVADNGEGMDAATMESIFQPFVTRKDGYGTGLGLSLSRTIMQQHGGTIRVSGERNVGTTVTLHFPRKEDPC
jgi:signal transduction histidine kinase